MIKHLSVGSLDKEQNALNKDGDIFKWRPEPLDDSVKTELHKVLVHQTTANLTATRS